MLVKMLLLIEKQKNNIIAFITVLVIEIQVFVPFFEHVKSCKTIAAIVVTVLLIVQLLITILVDSIPRVKKLKNYLRNSKRWISVEEGVIFYDDNLDVKITYEPSRRTKDIQLSAANNYLEILRDFPISETLWNVKKDRLNCACEEHISFLKVRVLYKSLGIFTFDIVSLLLKRYPDDNDLNVFYLPCNLENSHTPSDIKKLTAFSVCEILYNLHHDNQKSNQNILDLLNYDFLKDRATYINTHNAFLYMER